MARRAEDAGAVGLVIVDNEAACFPGILEVLEGLGFRVFRETSFKKRV